MLPALESAQKLGFIHVKLECLAAIDEDDRDLLVVSLPQVSVAVDVDLAPRKVVVLSLPQRLLHHVAEMAPLSRIDHNLMHTAIVRLRLNLIHPPAARRLNGGDRTCSAVLH